MHRGDIIRNVEKLEEEKVLFADQVVEYISKGKSHGRKKVTNDDLGKFLHSYEKQVRKQIKDLNLDVQENILNDEAKQDRTIKYVARQERENQPRDKKH